VRRSRWSLVSPAPEGGLRHWWSAQSACTRSASRRSESHAALLLRYWLRPAPANSPLSQRATSRRSVRPRPAFAEPRTTLAADGPHARGGAEQRENTIAGGLGEVAVIVMDGVDHQLERRIDDGTGFLGIEVFDQFHRAFDVGE